MKKAEVGALKPTECAMTNVTIPPSSIDYNSQSNEPGFHTKQVEACWQKSKSVHSNSFHSQESNHQARSHNSMSVDHEALGNETLRLNYCHSDARHNQEPHQRQGEPTIESDSKTELLRNKISSVSLDYHNQDQQHSDDVSTASHHGLDPRRTTRPAQVSDKNLDLDEQQRLEQIGQEATRIAMHQQPAQPTNSPSKPNHQSAMRSPNCHHTHHQLQPQNHKQQHQAAKGYVSSNNTSTHRKILTATNNHQNQHQHQQNQQSPNYAHQRSSSVSSTSAQRSQDTRTHVVGELYDTERSYVESLEILVEKYMKPLKNLDSNKALIDASLVDEIFHNLPEILEHHELFLTALQERLSSDWESSQRIASVLIETFTSQQIIETYTAFINNWKNARQAIKMATQAKPAFEKFLENMAREHKNKLTLDALLIMPVQRIPRYELLIKELIKHTPEDHPDYACLLEAQEKIHKLALKIDHAEKEMMHQEQLKDLEALIEGHVELQHPERDFLRYDLVTILSTSSLTIAKKERVLFLFCDLLIMTSLKKKSSKRTNLQLAFSNSYNDLSLLEGNKFKLLFKLNIDQIDIRIEDDELAAMQAPEDVEQQKQLKQQLELLREKRNGLQSDMSLLRKIEFVSTNLTQPEHRNQIVGQVKEMCTNIGERLIMLEQNEEQIEQEVQEHKRKSLMNIIPHQQFINLTSGQQAIQQHHQDQLATSFSQSNSISSVHNNQQTLSTSPKQNIFISQSMSQSASNNSKLNSADGSNTITTTTTTTTMTNNLSDEQGTQLELVIYNYNTNLSTASNVQAQQQQQHATDSHVIGAEQQDPFQTNTSLINQHNHNLLSSASLDAQLPFNSNMIVNHNSPSSHNIINAYNNNNPNSQTNTTQSSATYDTLVIGFTSYDRRQAFLHSFVEAKNQRYRQHRHQTLLQQQKVFNSAANQKPSGHLLVQDSNSKRNSFRCKGPEESNSNTKDETKSSSLVAAIPNSLNPLQLANTVSNLMNRISPTSLTGSSTSNNNNNSNNIPAANDNRDYLDNSQHSNAPMRHQLSAPTSVCAMDTHLDNQVLDMVGQHPLNNYNSSSNTIPRDIKHHQTPCLNNNQLHHQPASYPTPCLNNLSNHINGAPVACCQSTLSANPSLTLEETNKIRLQTRRLERVKEIMGSESELALNGLVSESGAEQGQEACNLQIGQNKSIYKWAPKFLNAIPLNFLNTQHLSMQFTCSILKHNFLVAHEPTKSQFVEDKTGQFWVCLSNGFVSHIALIVMVKQATDCIEKSASNNADQSSKTISARQADRATRYDVIPLIQSAGDVCKSQITCICQVNCPQPKVHGKQLRKSNLHTSNHETPSAKSCGDSLLMKNHDDSEDVIFERMGSVKNPKIAIESVSPPVDIKSQVTSNRLLSAPAKGLSESAPTAGCYQESLSPKPALPSSTPASFLRSPSEISTKPLIKSPETSKERQLNNNYVKEQQHGFSSLTVSRVQSLEPQSIRHLHQAHHLDFDCKHHNHLNNNGQVHHHHNFHSHQHSHQHHYQHHHHQHSTPHTIPNNVYSTRNNTVPITQLRRSLERQMRLSNSASNDSNGGATNGDAGLFLIDDDRTSGLGDKQKKSSSESNSNTKADRAQASKKSFRPSKLLLHQTSFKTNSILARLVGGGSKKSPRQKANKPGQQTIKSPDKSDGGKSNENNANKSGHFDAKSSIDGSFNEINNCIVSPLSSNGSSLNSSATNSSITINSVCASSPNHSRCDFLIHSYSASCCAAPMSLLSSVSSRPANILADSSQCISGIRSRSATVPSRPPSTQPLIPGNCTPLNELEISNMFNVSDISHNNSCTSVNKLLSSINVHGASRSDTKQTRSSEILLHDRAAQQQEDQDGEKPEQDENYEVQAMTQQQLINSALWLGCDDGSLIVIDCLANEKISTLQSSDLSSFADQCNVCDMNQHAFECSNFHSEVKLEAPICDILLYEDKNVFVALANGQLVVFSRLDDSTTNSVDKSQNCDQINNEAEMTMANNGGWSLTNPNVIKMAPNELNTTSKICKVSQDHLWYSYGRNVIIFNIKQMLVIQSIMAPSSNLSLQIQIPISISQMVLTGNGQGIWILFNHSQIVQLYSTQNCLLMAELNIRDSISRMLLFGNEIIRHHKISTLRATSLLVVNVGNNNKTDRVFIGTSAGLILSMDLSHDVLQFDNQRAADHHVQQLDLKTKIVSLRHGHCGSVKFIHQIPAVSTCQHFGYKSRRSYKNNNNDPEIQSQKNSELEHEETLLVSGGPGVDLYGPDIVQRLQRMNVDEDDTSHLIIWKM